MLKKKLKKNTPYTFTHYIHLVYVPRLKGSTENNTTNGAMETRQFGSPIFYLIVLFFNPITNSIFSA